MKVKNVEILLFKDKLSNCAADAYVLPFYPRHVLPDAERYEALQAGVVGVRKFVEYRLGCQPLSMGECKILSSEGGKAGKLAAIICRNKDVDKMACALERGLHRLWANAARNAISVVAMPPLCVTDGLDIAVFAERLCASVMRCLKTDVTTIKICEPEQEVIDKLTHILK